MNKPNLERVFDSRASGHFLARLQFMGNIVGIGGTGKGIEAISPNFLWIDHCLINGALQAIYVVGHPADPAETKAQITINFNRLTNNWSQIQLNGLHLDPHIAIGWNEVISRPGSTDAINIDRSS